MSTRQVSKSWQREQFKMLWRRVIAKNKRQRLRQSQLGRWKRKLLWPLQSLKLRLLQLSLLLLLSQRLCLKRLSRLNLRNQHRKRRLKLFLHLFPLKLPLPLQLQFQLQHQNKPLNQPILRPNPNQSLPPCQPFLKRLSHRLLQLMPNLNKQPLK